MSRNSKNARRHAEARERSKNRKNGSKGPKINSSKPGVKTYRTDENGKPRDDRRKAMAEFEAKITERIAKRWGKHVKPPVH